MVPFILFIHQFLHVLLLRVSVPFIIYNHFPWWQKQWTKQKSLSCHQDSAQKKQLPVYLLYYNTILMLIQVISKPLYCSQSTTPKMLIMAHSCKNVIIIPLKRNVYSNPTGKFIDHKNETKWIQKSVSILRCNYLVIGALLSLPSVLWRCWLGDRKGIRPVKNWVVGCWHGYLSGTPCRLAYGPADATATHCLLLQ